jgi:hypothetical protein
VKSLIMHRFWIIPRNLLKHLTMKAIIWRGEQGNLKDHSLLTSPSRLINSWLNLWKILKRREHSCFVWVACLLYRQVVPYSSCGWCLRGLPHVLSVVVAIYRIRGKLRYFSRYLSTRPGEKSVDTQF